MKQYSIQFTQEVYSSVCVLAESKEDARDIFWEDRYSWLHDADNHDCEIIRIDDIEEG